VLVGVVPTTAPATPPSVKHAAQAVAELTDRLGFNRSLLASRVGVTPACGLAGASGEWARKAIELARKVADALAEGA